MLRSDKQKITFHECSDKVLIFCFFCMQAGRWVATEGIWNSGEQSFTSLRDCFYCTTNIVEEGWHNWYMNKSGEGVVPNWSHYPMSCLSRWA